MVSNAGHVTRQVAAQLNCPLSDEDLIVCLRNKEVQDLLNVQVKLQGYVEYLSEASSDTQPYECLKKEIARKLDSVDSGDQTC